MKDQAKIVSDVLKALTKKAVAGVSLLELDDESRKLIKEAGAEPFNLGYKPDWAKDPFPAALVTSVNDCIGHGIPTTYKLKEGDLLNMDLGIKYRDLCGDAAISVPIGEIENKHMRLLRYAKRALYEGIKAIKEGVTVKEIAQVVQNYSWRMGYKTNKKFCGHAIGKMMHEPPIIPFFTEISERYEKTFTGVLKAGQVVCLEPFLTFEDEVGYLHSDGWSLMTRDHKYSAMFEHMVLVTKTGHEILTDHFNKDMFEDYN